MSINRRDFVKLVGVSLASLVLAGCRLPLPASCYAPIVPTDYPFNARSRLRRCWMSFDLLAGETIDEASQGGTENSLGQLLNNEHRQALDELVTAGDLTPAVADLVQEAYAAAVYHVWRLNAPITCYEPSFVDYAPASAGVLVQQSKILSEIAGAGTIDRETLAKARIALEHDMAYYSLTDAQVASLYERLVVEWQSQMQNTPAFENLNLEITPDAQTAAQFIISLLVGQ